jgi:hypothetical protein
MELVTEQFKSWAINTRRKEGHGYIDPLWWFGGAHSKIPLQLEGCSIALFPTRAMAREAVKDCREAFPKAVVERVTVTISKSV